MKPKSIDLANKCGSCDHFDPIDGTCSGYCLRNKYGENVVHDPEHPYWQVQRSRVKCADYNKKLPTNADHIRSMTDEELKLFLCSMAGCSHCNFASAAGCTLEDWLKQPYKEET